MNLSGSVKINKCGMLILTISLILLFYYLIFNNVGFSRQPKHYAFMLRNQNEINLRKLLIGGIQAAQMGGVEVLAVSHDIQAKSKGKTLEGADDQVTNADLRSHCVMKQGLKRLFSKVTVVSEEDEHAKKCPDVNHFELDPTVIDEDIQLADDYLVHADDVTVWIDPLDATQEYTGKFASPRTKRFMHSAIVDDFLFRNTEMLFQYVTTMVCVAVKGEPIIGIIHVPFAKQTIWAWKNVAVSEQLRKIYEETISPLAAVKNPKIIVSRSHKGNVKDYVRNIFGDKTPIISAGGAGYKVLQVVFNNATAYMHLTNIKKWDLCAGNAILDTLHGSMTTLENEAITYAAGESATNINKDGVLATLRHHKYYATQIHDYQTQMKFFKPT